MKSTKQAAQIDRPTATPYEITIHTDGACKGNPGPGGWAAVLRRYSDGEVIKKCVLHGSEKTTTNNRMEMLAALKGLKRLNANEIAPITVISDNQLLVRGMTEWVAAWQSKGWRKSDGKEVANKDLWLELLDVCAGKDVNWQWVRGHNGEPYNEEVDALASRAATEQI